MALIDYFNRKYDYLGVQNTVGPGERRLGLELFNASNSGQITTGIQKLTQRWLLEFLTEAGSMPGLPGRGTNFMRAARTGVFRTPINVRSEFALADLTLRQILQAEETDDTPPDERFTGAEITNLAVLPGFDVSQKSGTTAVFLTLNVKITSQAGDARAVIVPIEILPRD